MKKILLVISMISVLFLAGCNTNQNVENNNVSDYQHEQIETNADNSQQLNDTQSNIPKNDKEIESNDITVVDALNFNYQLFEFKLPKIVGNTTTIDELNQKMLDEMLPSAISEVAMHESMSEVLNKGASYNYKYIIKSNILVIHIYSSIPEGGTGVPKSGVFMNSYYYDIAKDKILSVGEAAKALGLKLDGISSRDGKILETYDELDEFNDYIIGIDENEVKFIFEN